MLSNTYYQLGPLYLSPPFPSDHLENLPVEEGYLHSTGYQLHMHTSCDLDRTKQPAGLKSNKFLKSVEPPLQSKS